MEDQPAKKYVSLNKLLTTMVIVSYVVFLLLLLWMDTILVLNYRREKRAEEKQQVIDYADTLNEHLDRMEELLYDIYAYSDDFRSLSGPLTELEEFDSFYNIDYIMRNRVALYRWISGYMLNYYENGDWRYYFESTSVDLDRVEKMKSYLMDRILEGNDWKRLITRFDGQIYCFLFCRRESVSLCGIYDLSRSVPYYAEELENRGNVYFYSDGELLGAADDKEGEDAENLILSAGLADSFEDLKGGREYFGKRVGGTDLWVVYARPVTIFTFMNSVHILLFLLTFSTLIIAWFVYRYIRRNIFHPLQSLVETMNEVSRGNWDSVFVHDSRLEEIQKVDEAFNVMVSEIKKQKILYYEQTIEKQKAQMQYLQLQLKPHFYLNGLKTLNMLAMEGDSEKAQDLIMHLSCHLRYLLQADRPLVPLSSEMDYTKNYGELQAGMYGRGSVITWDVQGDVGQVRVPTLCIQTFVENSFKYAWSEDPGGRLAVGIKISELNTQDGRFLDIIVRDNGKGYPLSVLDEINGEPGEESVSVGINNLKRRCFFIYGGREEYNFYNSGGAVSEIVLPCSRGSENETVSGGRSEGDHGEPEKER